MSNQQPGNMLSPKKRPKKKNTSEHSDPFNVKQENDVSKLDNAHYKPELLTLHSLLSSSSGSPSQQKHARQSFGNNKTMFQAPQRLNKILAHVGIGSRREIEQLILEGRISVNALPADLGQKVGPEDTIRVNGKPVHINYKPLPPRVLIYNKPEEELVTRDDPQQRPTVFKNLPKIEHGRWIAVGRLDYNTCGLLLFTNLGELANNLMHPRYQVQREYAVNLKAALNKDQIHQLRTGVQLEDGYARLQSITDTSGAPNQTRPGNTEASSNEENQAFWYRVVLKEGRNREIRRMFESLNATIVRLIRVRYANVKLPETLKRGAWQELSTKQVQSLQQLISGKRSSEGGSHNERPPAAKSGHKTQHPSGNEHHPRARKHPRQTKKTGSNPSREPSHPNTAPSSE